MNDSALSAAAATSSHSPVRQRPVGARYALAKVGSILRTKAVVVFFGTCLSMLIGIAFQSFLASRLGTGSLADVFYLGATIPTLFATVLLGSTPNALIRVATETPTLLSLSRGSIVPRLLVFATLLGGLMISISVLLLAGAPILDAETRRGVAGFLLVTAVVPTLALLSAVGAVLALARQKFVIGTYGGAANGVGLLAAAVALAPFGLTPLNLGIAVACGYLVQLLLVSSALRDVSRRTARPPVSVRMLPHGAVAGFLLLAGSSAIYKSQPLVERTVGSVLGAGLPAALGYADKITAGLMQLAVFGFALATLPSLSRELARGDEGRAAARLGASLAATAVSAAAVIAFGVASAGDLVRLLYERGAFSPHSVYLTRELVLFALPSVALGALAAPIVAVGYAAGHVRQIAIIGIAGFGVGTLATTALGAAVGFRGIVLGTGVGYGVTLAVFAALTPSMLPGWSWREFASQFGVAIGAAVGVAVAITAVVTEALPSDVGGAFGGLAALGLRLVVVLGGAFAVFVLLRSRSASPMAASEW